MSRYDRSEVEGAFRHYFTVGPIVENWDAMAQLFTDDGVYRDHFYGMFTGPSEISRYLEGTMGAAPYVYNPLVWYTIDDDRVVYKVVNRADNPEPGAPALGFDSLQVLTYAGRGRWSAQEDWWVMYEMKKFAAEFREASSKFPMPDSPLSRRDWGDWVDWARPAEGHVAHPSWMDRDGFTPISGRADIDFGTRNS
ncbi:nuclear transport factor 2 family protein [Rhodococcus sp. NPDC019627]|uniref:nuclear transport factor 2 family protein n=1 Tax=unclassified Rhodococcus (in: high G+C Gram-positive bacteria) TaxID=192944 RepID=UPI0033D7ABC1